MVHAEFEKYPRFQELIHLLRTRFSDVEGSSEGWDCLWVTKDHMRVSIDDADSFALQVKADAAS